MSGARWRTLEEAVADMALFDAPALPAITHGICPACVEIFERGGGHTIEPA